MTWSGVDRDGSLNDPAGPANPGARARDVDDVDDAPPMRSYRGKRLLDLSVVIVTAPAWLLLMAALAVLVRLRLGTPILFRQRRPGRFGAPFTLLKFRTMTDGRDMAGTLLPDAERLTAAGRLLRSSSLDELPEIFNVIAGSMSLVGPRPLLMQYLPLYSREHGLRHHVRPGITGLAQVSGRNAISWAEKFDLDVVYVRTNTLALDLRILLRTVRSVVIRDGISAPNDATMPFFSGYEEDRS